MAFRAIGAALAAAALAIFASADGQILTGSDGVAGFGRCSTANDPPRFPGPPPIRPTPQLCVEKRSFAGFTDIFNGRDLAGWEGDASRWRVVDGVITGTTTREAPLKENTFLIWSGEVTDFDLVFEWRVSAGGNSGLQYRSQKVIRPGVGPYVVRGLQYDIGGANEEFAANLFEEAGPTFLATRGSFSWDDGAKRETIGFIGGGQKPGDGQGGYAPTRGLIKSGAWNRGEIIARGDTIIQLVNGQVIALTIDEDKRRIKSGVIALQLHTGEPMKVEFRSLKLKKL